MNVGVVSDTHGLLRDEALEALAGVDHILHAGDVGDPGVLERLAGIAPVTAVWGNVDGPDLRARLPEVAHVELAGLPVVVAHLEEDARRAAPGRSLVVFGHSHRPSVVRDGDRVLLNPGSAGRRRFRLPVTLARVTVGVGAGVEVAIVELDV